MPNTTNTTKPTYPPRHLSHRARLAMELRSAHERFGRELTTEARDDLFAAARALRAELGLEEGVAC
jgi:hypothetical protein